MKAIQFNGTVPRYALGLAGQKISSSILWSGVSCTAYADVPEPALPSDEWVKLKTRYGDICGTDTGTIHLHTSPYLSPFASFPFTFGHENVGHVVETGARAGAWKVGDRVVVEPLLWCKPRGFEEGAMCRFCARGEINLCEHFARGALPPGILVGGCRATGGAWGEFFVAHASQLYRVPDNVTDENALLVEPFAVGLHAALQFPPRPEDKVLILGAGIIGLLTLAALRASGCQAALWVLARYPFQAQAAHKLGATAVIDGKGDYYADIAGRTGGQLLTPLLGKRVLNGGGVDVVYECVGSDESLDDAVRLTRNRGSVIVVGVPGVTKNVDWTPIFTKELQVRPSYTYNHVEPWRGASCGAFDIALELMSRQGLDLSWLVTHKFKLEQYAQAFSLLEQRGSSQALKAVFEF